MNIVHADDAAARRAGRRRFARSCPSLDPALPVVKLQSMDDVFAEAIGRPRLLAQLLGIFAGLAILLAAIGSYGVLSYMVTERRREIGIRMALGADRASVLRMVLSQGLRLTLVGVAAGLAAAFAMNRVLASLLFGVRPSDPATIGAVVALIGGGGARRLLPAGAAGDAGRSDDCVARGVEPFSLRCSARSCRSSYDRGRTPGLSHCAARGSSSAGSDPGRSFPRRVCEQ